jgi:hypothetical protein
VLKPVLDLFKLVWTLGQETRDNKQAIEKLEVDLKRMDERMDSFAQQLQALASDLHHLKVKETHEKEKLVLRLENALLRFERRLPPPRSSEEDP